MINKLEKLSELKKILDSGAISLEEFDTLKKEILNGSNVIPEIIDNIKQDANKEKIILNSYYDDSQNLIQPPNINYLNFKDISDEENNLLKSFLKGKIKNSPNELTKDEIKIADKIFSPSEITKIKSEMSGFQHPWTSIFAVIFSSLVLSTILISPILIFFVGGTSLLMGLYCTFFVLTKNDSTKLDKAFGYFAIIINIISLIVFTGWRPFESENNSNNSNSIDCSKNASVYNDGYSSGSLVKSFGESTSCETYVSKYNERLGRNLLTASECFCAGFNQGKNGLENEYGNNGTQDNDNKIEPYNLIQDDINENQSANEYENSLTEDIDSANNNEKKQFETNEYQSPDEIIKKAKSWDVFNNSFLSALELKDKEKIKELTYDGFFDGFSRTVKREWFSDQYYSSEEKKWISNQYYSLDKVEKSFKRGITSSDFKDNSMNTIDNILFFIYRDNQWYWGGFISD